MAEDGGLMPDEEYQKSVDRHQTFKAEIHELLIENYKGVARDTPNGRHNLEFSFEEDFFGFTRRWIVVTNSGETPLGFERASRIVGIYKDELEHRIIDGVLVVTENGANKFATDFLASNSGFLHRTLADLRKQRPITRDVVTVDHAAQGYLAAVDKITETRELLRGDNGDEMPYSVKQRILTELEAGLTLLKAQEIRLELVVEVIIKALRFIVKTLAHSATGMVAGAAIVELGRAFGFH
jgi:hypothetical protein